MVISSVVDVQYQLGNLATAFVSWAYSLDG